MNSSIYLFLLVELIVVSYIDLSIKKIHNVWPLINIALFVVLTLLLPEDYRFSIKTLFFSFAWIIVGFAFFLVKIMGAGDSKYLFSFYLLVPHNLQESAITCLLYSTIAVGGSLFLINTINNVDRLLIAYRLRDIGMVKGVFGKKFAFAPVILLSWIWFGWINLKIIF
jgi:prepilin peptidase CpaA